MTDSGPTGIQPVQQQPMNGTGGPPPDDVVDDDSLLSDALRAFDDGGDEEKPTPSAKSEAKPAPRKDIDPELKDLTEEGLDKFAISLTREKRKLREKREAFEAETGKHRQEIESERSRFESERAAHTELVERASKSPLAALEALGWSYEELQAYVMSEGQIPYEKRVKEIEERFDKRLTDKAKELEEKHSTVARQQVMQQAERFKYESERRFDALLANGAYPLVAKLSGSPGIDGKPERDSVLWTVLGHVSAAYRDSGGKKVLAVDDVLQQIENRLEHQRKILVGDETERAGTKKPEVTREPKSLTNQLAAERGVRPQVEDEDLDDETLLRKAMEELSREA